ncbi:MAG: hypothetical protein CMJ78_09375 [Planctomycetaceae bacterium]|nr:hypothetical protein [Planctomycetaceae bacterium]
MENPLIVILSRAPDLLADIPERWQNTFEIHCCEDLDEASATALKSKPCGIVADFTAAVDSWHAQDGLLEQLATHVPDVEVCMLTQTECAEPLERRAACTETVHHLRGDLDVAAIDEWAETKFGDRIANISNEPEATHDEAETVLHGITRLFETNTPRLKRMLTDLEIASQHDVTMLLRRDTLGLIDLRLIDKLRRPLLRLNRVCVYGISVVVTHIVSSKDLGLTIRKRCVVGDWLIVVGWLIIEIQVDRTTSLRSVAVTNRQALRRRALKIVSVDVVAGIAVSVDWRANGRIISTPLRLLLPNRRSDGQ